MENNLQFEARWRRWNESEQVSGHDGRPTAKGVSQNPSTDGRWTSDLASALSPSLHVTQTQLNDASVDGDTLTCKGCTVSQLRGKLQQTNLAEGQLLANCTEFASHAAAAAAVVTQQQ